jgi:hypothetical protein
MPAPRGFDHVSATNQIAQAASPPTLAKNARMGHPQWEWCMRRSPKVGTRAIPWSNRFAFHRQAGSAAGMTTEEPESGDERSLSELETVNEQRTNRPEEL